MGWCSDTDNASQCAEANGGDAAIGDPVQGCPLQDANLVWVKWVDGGSAGSEDLVDSATQYVNLPRDSAWVNNTQIDNLDRLGLEPRIKVKFDKPGSHSFKISIARIGGTPEYTASEKGRSAAFNHSTNELEFTTDADGTKIVSGLKLVGGGGYEFQATAKDGKGAEKSTGTLTTRRLFWVTMAKMTGLGSALGSIAAVESEYGTHHIDLVERTGEEIPRQHNIGTPADSATLRANVDAMIDGQAHLRDRKPYLLVNAYTDHLAVRNANIRLRSAPATQVGPGKPAVTLAVRAAGLRAGDGVRQRYLWHSIVPGQGWFVSAQYTASDGTTTAIPQAKVSAPAGDYKGTVTVDVTGLPAGQGRVEVRVNIVDRMRGGLAFGGYMTCVCTRAWWRTQTDQKQKCTLIHEFGHKVQMVVKGAAGQPDRAASQYDDSGHVGSHCHKGCPAGEANYGTTAFKNASTCVMFGTVNEKLAFCADCAPGLKKVDLSAGF